MFKKSKCKKCNKKVNSDYDFCPYCGFRLNSDSGDDWGMLGRNDNFNSGFSNPMFGGNMLGKMLGSAMKMLQKEMNKNNFNPGANFRLMVNGKEVNLNNFNQKPKPVKKIMKSVKLPSAFSEKNLKKFSNLPREEPATNVRRLADKVIYEVELEGVKSIEDVAIIKLEKSIEIKAIAEDKSYFKIIPINLPVINYEFAEQKLVLEFGVK